MPYLNSLPDDAGPPHVFKRYPDIYGPFSEMSQALMNGASSLSRAERELILAYAAGVAGCDFVTTGHAEVAYAHGIPRGTVEQLLEDPDTAPVEAPLRPLLGVVRKLAVDPDSVTQADADEVFAAGWDEQALHDAVAITGRAAFMHRMVAGLGFAPLDREVAASHASKRVQRGYINVYRTFRQPD